ncbi:hypothetical protein [Vibrio gigantis]|uniref:hypothetical protein n=1 Tax=Vibrio gigantis TaxID=296199 RepID=UPI001BFE9885|nr:hypothetical protein [Vibrio gigantis]
MRKSLMWCFSAVTLVGCNFEYSYTDVSTTEGIKTSFSSTHRVASSRVDTDCIEHVLSNNPQFKLEVLSDNELRVKSSDIDVKVTVEEDEVVIFSHYESTEDVHDIDIDVVDGVSESFKKSLLKQCPISTQQAI